jgi:hypothetical protein
MSVQICLEPVKHQTAFVPLTVIGYCVTRSGLLNPLWYELMSLKLKSYDHSGFEKLQDLLVAIMAGCRSLAQVNTRIRPDRVLAQGWQRSCFAEQSNLSRLLDALTADEIAGLRNGNSQLLRQYSQLHQHDWRNPLIIDIDPTSLITSKRSEGSRKGWVSGQRNQYCRHVLRFMVAGYHESLLSLAYPGDRHGYEYCKPALQQLLTQWSWSKAQRQQTILRSDAEQGTDGNLSYMLWQSFQVLMKAYSGTRTQAWVKRTPESAWQTDPQRPHHWLAPTPLNLRLGRRLNGYLLRWLDAKGRPMHATLLSTLALPGFALWSLYEQRGCAEVEIRADKSGLQLHLRRKHSLDAQEAWVVLTDIAHNLLAWLQPWMLTDSAFAAFGPKRLVQDLLTIPGHVYFDQGKLSKVALWETHPFADEMRFCLHKLLKTFALD